MKQNNATLKGIWIPLITPFYKGALDKESIAKLTEHYKGTGIEGLVLAGTTGESMTISESETLELVETVQKVNNGALKVYLGLTGSDTASLVKKIERISSWQVDGYLIATPYYTRPSQEGLYSHFCAVAAATKLPIILYNIPYRTGVNLENQTTFRLAELENIVGIKDCCANPTQTTELIKKSPEGFSVLVGDDGVFFTSVVQGAKGGILASSHVAPSAYVKVYNLLQEEKLSQARDEWNPLADLIPLVFAEPNPAPLKSWLFQQGLLRSDELRLPMTSVSKGLAERIGLQLKGLKVG